MTKRLTFRLAVAFMMLEPAFVLAQPGISYAPAMRIDETSLSGLISDPIIQSFDLSPDGASVALLVASSVRKEAPLYLVTQDVATKRVITFRQFGRLTLVYGNFAPQVRFASDGRFLVVQDFNTIQVLDPKTLEPLRAISPPVGNEPLIPLFITGASGKDVFVCAFGLEPRQNFHFHTTSVEIEVVDVSSGQRLGEWSSGDVPQSISPNGDLIAVSSLQPHQGVLPLDVVDVHGEKVAELTGGFAFKDAGPSKQLGRVLGVFVGNEELLLTPDENVDQTGHHSGDSLQLVSVAGVKVQVQQSIKPRHYAPQGDLAVSANGRIAVSVSWYVPPRLLAHEGALPASSPELLLFQRETSFQLEASLPIHGLGLRVSGWLENRRPRLSSDGSVLAVAQRSGVTILKKTLVSKTQ